MKKIICVVFMVFMLLGLSACSINSTAPAAEDNPQAAIEVTDLKGRTVVFDKVPEKIVSLSPANTEIVFALGAGSKVVGVTSYCDYPAEVASVEKIGTFEGPNLELIKQAQPDVVLAGGYIQEDLIKALEDLNIPVISTEALGFNGIYDSIKLIGKITGTDHKADEIVKDMKDSIAAIKVRSKAPTVFYMVWTDPITTAGSNTFINDVIKAAGGINVASKVEGWAKYSAEELIKDNPDVLISSKYSTVDGISEDFYINNDIFKQLECVQKNNVYIMSDDNIISRPGPRIIQAIEEIAKALGQE